MKHTHMRWMAASLVALAYLGVLPVRAAEPPCAAPPCSEESAGAPLRVGVAKTDITWHIGNERLGPALITNGDEPTLIDPLAFPGLHSRVYAKALVVEGDEPFAIVRTDTPGISGDLYESVTQRIELATGIAPERVLLAGTHTHNANQGAFPHPVHGALLRSSDPREKEFIAAQIAQAVIDAADNLRPAAFAVGSGSVTLPAYNRRYWIRGQHPSNDPDLLDPEFGVLRFDDAETGEPIAVVMNYGLHPVVLHPEKQPLVTADFVGLAERDLERSFAAVGEAPMAIWMTGAVGDQETVYSGTRSYPEAEWTGRVFAAEAARVLAELDPQPLSQARVASKIIPLPEPGASGDDIGATPSSIGPRVPWTAAPLTIPSSVRLQAIEFANATENAVFLSWPGEPIRDIGVALKTAARHLGFGHAFVLGLANDYGGYWLTPAEYDKGFSYERLLAFYGRTSANYVARHVLDLADFLATGHEIEQVDLPPHAQADRAMTAAIAAAGIALEEELAGAHAPVPEDLFPPKAMTQPLATSGATPVRFDWRGGSPEVARDWVPVVSVQRNVGRPEGVPPDRSEEHGPDRDDESLQAEMGRNWKTVAQEGAGEILLWERTVTPGDNRWTAVWQPLFDTPAGDYRFFVEGRRQIASGDVPYTVESDTFHVGPCDCIKDAPLTDAAEPGGGVRISVEADYPVDNGRLRVSLSGLPDLRLLPERVTTGHALVDVMDDGTIVDTLTLSFVSNIVIVSKCIIPKAAQTPVRICEKPEKNEVQILEPVERGAFEAVWPGTSDVDFVLRSIEDGNGNTS